MALITRTPWTDDDGTGTTGTILNNDEKDLLYDQIDDVIADAIAEAGGGSSTEQTTAATGAQNDFSLSAGFTVVRCTGAAPVFSGFRVSGAAPSPGDRVKLICLGTTLKVLNQTLSTAANQIITPSVAGQIVGLNGAIELVYDGATDRWRVDTVDPGTPIAIAFSAGDFTGSASMTWTVAAGDVAKDTFVQRGQIVTLIATYDTTTVGGTPAVTLQKALPNGFVAQSEQWLLLSYGFDNNVATQVSLSVTASGTLLRIRRFDAANWAAATNTTYIYLPMATILVN